MDNGSDADALQVAGDLVACFVNDHATVAAAWTNNDSSSRILGRVGTVDGDERNSDALDFAIRSVRRTALLNQLLDVTSTFTARGDIRP